MAAISRLIRDEQGGKKPVQARLRHLSDHSAHGRQHRRGRPDYLDPVQRAVPQIPARAVYYTAFRYRHPAAGYDLPWFPLPVWRVGRLYQADRLLQLYGFTPDEILPPEHASLSLDLDPKTDWALRNPQFFPSRSTARPYESLVRVPGIGDVYARRITPGQAAGGLDRDALVRLGIPMKKMPVFHHLQGAIRGRADARTARSAPAAPGGRARYRLRTAAF